MLSERTLGPVGAEGSLVAVTGGLVVARVLSLLLVEVGLVGRVVFDDFGSVVLLDIGCSKDKGNPVGCLGS